ANLPDEEILKLFKTYHGNIKEAFEQAKSVGRMDVAERLEAELAIIQEYLPKTLSVEKTRELVMEEIQESGAKSKKELGLVMKILKKHGSAIDGKLAKELTDDLLGG